MKNLLQLSIASVVLTAITSFGALSSCAEETETTVYICKGKYSKKYHYKKNCHGLNNCSTDIYKTTLDSAKKAGRKICGFED
ncbi:hypothetical protein [Zunongwangia pacifica]|uniref:Lipoprotein n=1 Tax=Zunongwangia pacifica TaxID=2911062 RepID=A0A9X1ZTK4_9FLAO|nr:hypothetical protein [Zunongwangia pacifica]MCL6218188.1 hypothetical protein [Zunongwangia pacifica]